MSAIAAEEHLDSCELDLERPADGTLVVGLKGSWRIGAGLPSDAEVGAALAGSPPVRNLKFDAERLSGWDSGLVTFLVQVINHCAERKVEVDRSGLPDGVQRLLKLAFAVPERQGARRGAERTPFLVRVGKASVGYLNSLQEVLAFIGEVFAALLRLLRGKARVRRADLALIMQECGAQALPIITLISFLVGLILAFVGALQLQQFGAQIFVANLVGIGMARSIGAMMTGVIMAGRTGAAFAAQLGTMQVNEEIDALSTMGISPMEFLVVPRMLALTLMMPLLCLYSDLMGILGGLIVGVTMLDLSVAEYINQTRNAVRITDITVGLINCAVYGVIVAVTSCLRGMQCRGSASAVGAATTSAVVTSLVYIVLATALLTVIFDVLGI
jgi:phospholipid/cholesterol/gamma-HCH transport system permease protein